MAPTYVVEFSSRRGYPSSSCLVWVNRQPILASRVLALPLASLPRRPSVSRRSEEHTSELQSRGHLVCRLLLEKKKDDVAGARIDLLFDHDRTAACRSDG